jgi:hypothetical protein
LAFAALAAVAVCRDLKTDWGNPLQLRPDSGSQLAVRPHWFLGGILLALWLSLNFLAALALVALYLSGLQWPASLPAWCVTLLLAAFSLAIATAVLRALMHVSSLGNFTTSVQRYLTGLFQISALVVILALLGSSVFANRGTENLILWYNYTVVGFNGVSLALPLTLSLLATVALCYGLLTQYHLATAHFVPRPLLEGEAAETDDATREQLLFPILGKLRRHGKERLPVNHVLVAALISVWFLWIGWHTVVTDAAPALFAAMLLMLLVSSVLWGVRLIKTVMVVRQFVVDMDSYYEWLDAPNRLEAWKSIFDRRPSRRRQDLGIFFHSGRPRRNAAQERQRLQERYSAFVARAAAAPADAELAKKVAEAREDLHAAWVEQFAEQYTAHLRTLIRWLLISGVLIFLAATSYPFNTGQYLRLTTSFMLAMLGIVVVYAYVSLDRDPLMSLIVGSKPFELRLDWNFFRTTAPILGIALVTLLSQTFPEAWHWINAITEPVLRGGP